MGDDSVVGGMGLRRQSVMELRRSFIYLLGNVRFLLICFLF
jgi:hypothetical protein